LNKNIGFGMVQSKREVLQRLIVDIICKDLLLTKKKTLARNNSKKTFSKFAKK
jgi:hypothetical protein